MGDRNRKLIRAFGRPRAADYVKVFRETVTYRRGDGQVVDRPLVRVQWRERDRRPDGSVVTRLRTESWDATRAEQAKAVAWAEGKHDALGAAPVFAATVTRSLRDLWDAYTTAKVDSWRPRTFALKLTRWRKAELFIGRDTVASSVTRERMDELKRTLLAQGHAPNQVAAIIAEVRFVFRFAVDRDLIPPTKVTTYRPEFSKEAKRAGPKMAEYRRAARDKIVAQFDPRQPLGWRPWALATLLSFCGPRQTAARWLEWRDIDFGRRTITWRAELDKVGADDRVQPMPAPVFDALVVAYLWSLRDQYTGRFVFYGVQRRTRGQALARHDTHRAKGRTTLDGVTVEEKPWTYAAFHAQLQAAAKRAKVPLTRFSAAHGFRRGVARDVFEVTGSEKRAAEWIGDKSVKVVSDRYLLEREDSLRETADQIGGGKE